MGQRRCCIIDCKSVSNLPEFSDVKFHAFPTNEIVRNIWVKNCHIEQNRSITKSNVVCSRHFVESDYQVPKNGRRLLNSNAVPTVFAWGNEKSFSDHLAEAQQLSPTLDTSTKESTDKMPSETTPIVKTVKKMMSRSQANSAAEKQRSASAEEQTPNGTNPKSNKSRKSLDSATTPDKSDAKDRPIKSPSKKFEIAAQFAPGVKVEVQDLSGNWHNAKVAEVDQGEQEVLINFDKNVKAKGPTAFKLNDEWIAMDSSRLRLPVRQQFKDGDRCLARWTDSRKFKATVLRPLEDNRYEVLFDDGLVKSVKGIHMSKLKSPLGEKTPYLPPSSPITPGTTSAPVLTATPIIKKSFKLNPIPKFDLSEFNFPKNPEGEWCCPWINDTPIGDEGFLLNADGTRRPTVLVQDNRLPSGWTKHLYQRSSTSGKWDVVLVGPNNKRFRSKNDVKVYLEEIGQSYNPDIYDFSIHKRRAKDIGIYVFTKDYVPPVIPKPASDFKLDSSLDASLQQDFKQEPFTGFSPNESTSLILSKITQEINAETSTPIKIEPQTSTPTVGSLEEGYIYVGALKVQMVDNLFQCPKEGCNKSFRKENHLQIHVKHYHRELSQQLGACPNMTELAYFRTMGSTIDESSPKNQIPNVQYFEKTFQSEIRSIRKSLSPTRIKVEPKTEDPTTPLAPVLEEPTNETLKRKLITNQTSPEIREKRKPSATDKVTSPETISKLETLDENMTVDDQDPAIVPLTLGRKIDAGASVDSKTATQKTIIPRFKIGHAAKIKGSKVSRRKGKTLKKKFKRLGKGFKRKAFTVGNRRPMLQESIGISDIHHVPGSFVPVLSQSSRPNRLKFLQYSSIDSNSENSVIDQRSGSRYISENGELIKIVRMRQEEIINCLCSYGEEDGLMIQCELCLCWQHGGCNGIEKESEVPEKYVCYICRNPERARESMKYIHDQEWLYEGKLFHANYHAPSRKAPLRFDILKQSHTLTGNLLELKRSLHSLNVKINIAANKDHPKMYLWSKKWEQSPPRSFDAIQDAPKKIEPKLEAEQTPTILTNAETKKEVAESNSENQSTPQKSADADETISKNDQTEQTASQNTESTMPQKSDSITTESSIEKKPKIETKEIAIAQQPLKPTNSPKKLAKATPNIPEPEAAIDSLECQHRLLEHIQKEQNTILSRMQTIDAQIMALESMDDHPDTNSKADFSKTSQTIRMLLNDLAKIQKLASINEHSISYNPVESTHFL